MPTYLLTMYVSFSNCDFKQFCMLKLFILYNLRLKEKRKRPIFKGKNKAESGSDSYFFRGSDPDPDLVFFSRRSEPDPSKTHPNPRPCFCTQFAKITLFVRITMVCYYCYASQWFCYRSNQRLLKDQNVSFIDEAHAQVSTLFWNLVLKFPWEEALKTELSLIMVSLSKSSWCQEVYIATRGILCPPPHNFLDNTKMKVNCFKLRYVTVKGTKIKFRIV